MFRWRTEILFRETYEWIGNVPGASMTQILHGSTDAMCPTHQLTCSRARHTHSMLKQLPCFWHNSVHPVRMNGLIDSHCLDNRHYAHPAPHHCYSITSIKKYNYPTMNAGISVCHLNKSPCTHRSRSMPYRIKHSGRSSVNYKYLWSYHNSFAHAHAVGAKHVQIVYVPRTWGMTYILLVLTDGMFPTCCRHACHMSNMMCFVHAPLRPSNHHLDGHKYCNIW